MSNVLVLEAFGVNGPPIVATVAKQGHRVILASHQDLYDQFGHDVTTWVDEFWPVDYAAADIADVLVTKAANAGVVGVVTGWEFFTPLAAEVAHRLGVPANDPEKVGAARNKKDMAIAFARAGVRHARTTVIGPDDDLDEVGHALSYPAVIKPADNAGSCGVSVIGHAAELTEAVAQARSWPTEFPHNIPLDVDVLAQEYIGGREFSVETVGFDGELSHIAVTEKLTTSGSVRAELGHLVPARADGWERITDEASKALRAVGFRYGVAHTEIKLDDAGQAWVIETGVRPGGDLIPRLVDLAVGVDLIGAYVATATGERPDLSGHPSESTSAIVRFIVPPHEGTLEVLDNLPDGRDVVEAVFSKKPGDRIEAPGDNVSRLGHFILTGPHADALVGRADELLDQVKVSVR